MSEEDRQRETLRNNAEKAIYEEHPDVSLEDIKRIFGIIVSYCNITHPDGKVPYSVYRSMQACSVFDIRNKILYFLENRPENFKSLSESDLIKLVIGDRKYEKAMAVVKSREEERQRETLRNRAEEAIYQEYPDVSLMNIRRIFGIMEKYCNFIHPNKRVPFSVYKSMLDCSVYYIRNRILEFLETHPDNLDTLSAGELIKLIVGEEKYQQAIAMMQSRDDGSPPGTPPGPPTELERSLSAPDGGKRRTRRRKNKKMKKTMKKRGKRAKRRGKKGGRFYVGFAGPDMSILEQPAGFATDFRSGHTLESQWSGTGGHSKILNHEAVTRLGGLVPNQTAPWMGLGGHLRVTADAKTPYTVAPSLYRYDGIKATADSRWHATLPLTGFRWEDQ